jgi:hypothetical protein
METYTHLWRYLAEFLEPETLQTKFVQKIKTHILCSELSYRKLYRLWDNVEKYGIAWQATDDNAMPHRKQAICISDN